eukprot:TRINITY_DN3909_c0_g1_i1.p3 TRINITY_DN3909_c0_g1~~TRINITY_DN3909_c0_g1_i1.p3  ORF type:complete len:120 (+),score=32.34 TRINITY_DN3909_c0_g1_i1:234-593(+)
MRRRPRRARQQWRHVELPLDTAVRLAEVADPGRRELAAVAQVADTSLRLDRDSAREWEAEMRAERLARMQCTEKLDRWLTGLEAASGERRVAAELSAARRNDSASPRRSPARGSPPPQG